MSEKKAMAIVKDIDELDAIFEKLDSVHILTECTAGLISEESYSHLLWAIADLLKSAMDKIKTKMDNLEVKAEEERNK